MKMTLSPLSNYGPPSIDEEQYRRHRTNNNVRRGINTVTVSRAEHGSLMSTLEEVIRSQRLVERRSESRRTFDVRVSWEEDGSITCEPKKKKNLLRVSWRSRWFYRVSWRSRRFYEEDNGTLTWQGRGLFEMKTPYPFAPFFRSWLTVWARLFIPERDGALRQILYITRPNFSSNSYAYTDMHVFW